MHKEWKWLISYTFLRKNKIVVSESQDLFSRTFDCIIRLSGEQGSLHTPSLTPILDNGREVMQMSVFLALVQTLIGAATLGVALLALESGDPPHSDGSSKQNSED